MIKTTNNAKEFFEKTKNEPVWIYGYGNAGRWISYYMDKTGYKYEGFIDVKNCVSKNEGHLKTIDGSHRLIHPSEIHNVIYDGKINIIISARNVGSVMSDVDFYSHETDLYCLKPIYNDVLNGDMTYDIDRLLGFFRKKMLKKGKSPTIICNTCNDGMLYRALGLPMLSPTVNTVIEIEYFLKIAKKPQKYLSQEMEFSHFTSYSGKRIPVGKVDDIYIMFAHSEDADASVDLWNGMRKYVNYNDLVFIMSDNVDDFTFLIDYKSVECFNKIPYKHIYISKNGSGFYGHSGLYSANQILMDRDLVTDNYLDIVNWINI